MIGLEFEWDETKRRANRTKHGVDFAEAISVFGDPLGIDIADEDHSAKEERFLRIGLSQENRLVVVAYAERETQKGAACVRIISARPATRNERRTHEEDHR